MKDYQIHSCDNGKCYNETYIDNIREAVEAQANDESLWFISVSATEAYLQQALRDLHRVIESNDLEALNRIIKQKNDV